MGASRDEVWQLYDDIAGTPRWVPGVREIVYVSGPARIGTVYRERTRLSTAQWEIVEYRRPTRQVHQARRARWSGSGSSPSRRAAPGPGSTRRSSCDHGCGGRSDGSTSWSRRCRPGWTSRRRSRRRSGRSRGIRAPGVNPVGARGSGAPFGQPRALVAHDRPIGPHCGLSGSRPASSRLNRANRWPDRLRTRSLGSGTAHQPEIGPDMRNGPPGGQCSGLRRRPASRRKVDAPPEGVRVLAVRFDAQTVRPGGPPGSAKCHGPGWTVAPKRRVRGPPAVRSGGGRGQPAAGAGGRPATSADVLGGGLVRAARSRSMSATATAERGAMRSVVSDNGVPLGRRRVRAPVGDGPRPAFDRIEPRRRPARPHPPDGPCRDPAPAVAALGWGGDPRRGLRRALPPHRSRLPRSHAHPRPAQVASRGRGGAAARPRRWRRAAASGSGWARAPAAWSSSARRRRTGRPSCSRSTARAGPWASTSASSSRRMEPGATRISLEVTVTHAAVPRVHRPRGGAADRRGAPGVAGPVPGPAGRRAGLTRERHGSFVSPDRERRSRAHSRMVPTERNQLVASRRMGSAGFGAWNGSARRLDRSAAAARSTAALGGSV